MNRAEFHKLFKSVGPVVTPVIHALDEAQVHRNVEVSIEAGAAGVFIINHDYPPQQLLPVIRAVRTAFPGLWLGVNFLAVTGLDAFPQLAALAAQGCLVDGYWADNARIDERHETQAEADAIIDLHATGGWRGLYFGGVAFKKQRTVDPSNYARAATLSVPRMDVVTTSGIATGEEADDRKISLFRQALGDAPLALASGVTPDNAERYASDVDCFLVATGINRPGDFYNIEPSRLHALLALTRAFAKSTHHG